MIRIKNIASLVTKDAKLIDIGTDHAYLPIYLYKNNITHDITASDISDKVLKNALVNIDKHGLTEKIKVIKSDGFKNTNEKYDEAVIAGMGTNTIINILKSGTIPDSLIISSHNELFELRSFMQDFGYKIIKEITVLERGKYYDIIKYHQGKETLSEEELYLGKSTDLEYLTYLKNHYTDLYQKSQDPQYLKIIGFIERKLALK